MVQSAARSVPEYFASLPPERRAVMEEVRRLILANLPPGYEERMGFGMACYEIPLERYPDTYNRQPLCYIGLAATKGGCSLYLTGPYIFGEEGDRRFREAWAKSGKKLDMGKSCVRFRTLDDLALDLIAENVASVSVDDYIRQYEKVRSETASGRRPAKAKATPAARKSADKERKKVSANASRPPARRKGANKKGGAAARVASAAKKGQGTNKEKKAPRGGAASKAGRGRR